MISPITFTDADLNIEVRDPDRTPLVRLFRYPGSSFDEPVPQYRNGRFDPPLPHKDRFAVLYTADNIAAAAMECRVLCVDRADKYSYTAKGIAPYRVVRLRHSAPAAFIRVDGDIRTKLGIPRFTASYAPFQAAALMLFERYGGTFHGLSWESFHRGQPGRDYGFWHDRKHLIGLEPLQTEADCSELANDPEWLQFLREEPAIELRPDDEPIAAPAETAVPAAAAKPPMESKS